MLSWHAGLLQNLGVESQHKVHMQAAPVQATPLTSLQVLRWVIGFMNAS